MDVAQHIHLHMSTSRYHIHTSPHHHFLPCFSSPRLHSRRRCYRRTYRNIPALHVPPSIDSPLVTKAKSPSSVRPRLQAHRDQFPTRSRTSSCALNQPTLTPAFPCQPLLALNVVVWWILGCRPIHRQKTLKIGERGKGFGSGLCGLCGVALCNVVGLSSDLMELYGLHAACALHTCLGLLLARYGNCRGVLGRVGSDRWIRLHKSCFHAGQLSLFQRPLNSTQSTLEPLLDRTTSIR